MWSKPYYRCVAVGAVDWKIMQDVREALLEVRLNAGDKGRLLLSIDSSGGNLTALLSVVRVMQSVKLRYMTLSAGGCMSAAVLLAAAGTPGSRVALQSTRFMIHETGVAYNIDCGLSDFKEDVERFMVHRREELYAYKTMLAEISGRPADFWGSMMTKEKRFFSADDAKEFGIIDHVVDDYEAAMQILER